MNLKHEPLAATTETRLCLAIVTNNGSLGAEAELYGRLGGLPRSIAFQVARLWRGEQYDKLVQAGDAVLERDTKREHVLRYVTQREAGEKRPRFTTWTTKHIRAAQIDYLRTEGGTQSVWTGRRQAETYRQWQQMGQPTPEEFARQKGQRAGEYLRQALERRCKVRKQPQAQTREDE